MPSLDPYLLAQRLRSLKIVDPPAPWQRADVYAITGLQAVGYGEGSDLLLVVSTQGRGVFDGATGEMVMRDSDDSLSYLDPIKLTAAGIGPLDQQIVRIAGLYGGGLALTTQDGWELKEFTLDWPVRSVFLIQPDKTPQLVDHFIKIADDSDCELRVCGFSPTGQSFVIATSCELALYCRS